jgi:hypothetical protein
MLRRLMDEYRRAGERMPATSQRPWRPGLEPLESRLSPSVSALAGVLVAEPVQSAPSRIANPHPAPVDAQTQVIVAAAQAVRGHAGQADAIPPVVVASAAPATAPLALPAIQVSGQELPYDDGLIALPEETAEPEPVEVVVVRDVLDQARPSIRVEIVQPPAAESVAPASPQRHGASERTAAIVMAPAEPIAEQPAALAAEIEADTVATSALMQGEAGAAAENLPLLVWMVGMTCLLKLRWEQTRRAERRKPTADAALTPA